MLSLAKMVAGQEEYYLDLAREDYYLLGGEPPGQWLGRGARALGLDGSVGKDDLRRLMEGRSPHDGEPLGQVQEYQDGRARTVGFDLTFSAPKSISVLWSQASEELRAAIERAHFEAVREAISYLEDTASITRRGHGGRVIEPAELVLAVFEHGTSRAQDPQLHSHCLLLNCVRRADGSWGAIRSQDIFDHKMAAGTLYRIGLAKGLRDLGFDLRAEKTWFEVTSVPERVADFFSKRRNEIEEVLSSRGLSGPVAAEAIARTTRQVKEHVAREELFPLWQRLGKEQGFGPEQAAAAKQPHVLHAGRIAEAVVPEALKELTDSDSAFRELDLVRRVAEKVQAHGVAPSEVLSIVRRFLATSEQVVPLGVGQMGYPLYTSVDLHRTERAFLTAAEGLHASTRHAIGAPVIERVLERFSHLSDEQRQAVRHLTEPGGLRLLSGMAGSGKTTALAAAREIWESAGLKVFGTTLSARAAQQLEAGSGIRSSTIESLLWAFSATPDHASKSARLKLDDRTVLAIDEAGMVGSRHLARLLEAAEKAGAKVVLAGDAAQLQSIDAGGGFRALLNRLGGAELRELMRQRADWARSAVFEFAEGDSRAALSRYAMEGHLHVQRSRDGAISALVARWNVERTADLAQTLILAGTNRETAELNRQAQQARLHGGELGRSLSHKEHVFHERDRVAFHVNLRRLGVKNGDFGTVEQIQDDILHVKLDRTENTPEGLRHVRVSLRAQDLTVNAFGEQKDLLRVAYATTVHKAQGASVENAFVLAGGWIQDRELAYVQMSRAKGATRIFCDEDSAGEDLTELTRAMNRSREKILAHDHQLTISQQLAP